MVRAGNLLDTIAFWPKATKVERMKDEQPLDGAWQPRYFAVRRKVEFSETDMAGLVHFSNFFRYVEFAEAQFFEHLGESLIGQEAEGLVGWPRVRASCDYRAPLFFGDTVEVRLFVREVKIRAVEFGFEIYRQGEPMEKVARGKMTTVRVVRPVGAPPETMTPTGIGGNLLEKLNRYTESGQGCSGEGLYQPPMSTEGKQNK